ncbi:MAG: helix-hairpin-helix domain-containing protein, partial [Planctomycetes bacterium]|nr:helix-hairpin-helix domain-containing protein [Planctomycetota bacterium]
QAVMDGDWKTIATVKGIGRKTAERLILDLRGRMDDMKRTPSGAPQPAADDLVRVLTELGFSSNDARNAAQIAREELGVAASFEDLLRLSLQPHTLPK